MCIFSFFVCVCVGGEGSEGKIIKNKASRFYFLSVSLMYSALLKLIYFTYYNSGYRIPNCYSSRMQRFGMCVCVCACVALFLPLSFRMCDSASVCSYLCVTVCVCACVCISTWDFGESWQIYITFMGRVFLMPMFKLHSLLCNLKSWLQNW